MITRTNLVLIMLSERSETERQIPYDFTYIWNLKNKLTKYSRNRHITTENKLVVARGEVGRGMGERDEKRVEGKAF